MTFLLVCQPTRRSRATTSLDKKKDAFRTILLGREIWSRSRNKMTKLELYTDAMLTCDVPEPKFPNMRDQTAIE